MSISISFHQLLLIDTDHTDSSPSTRFGLSSAVQLWNHIGFEQEGEHYFFLLNSCNDMMSPLINASFLALLQPCIWRSLLNAC